MDVLRCISPDMIYKEILMNFIAYNCIRRLRYEAAERVGIAVRFKTLRVIIPICANCKSIWDDQGFSEQIEAYFTKHSEAIFSNGICPDSLKKLYPDIDLDKELGK